MKNYFYVYSYNIITEYNQKKLLLQRYFPKNLVHFPKRLLGLIKYNNLIKPNFPNSSDLPKRPKVPPKPFPENLTFGASPNVGRPRSSSTK